MKNQESDKHLMGMLDFVGRVTASATHEIKNQLAVINEQSHLLREMLAMALHGKEVDPDRLEQLSGRVVDRVERADQAVRRLNAFAHSSDMERTKSDPAQTIAALLRMFERVASLKPVTIEFDPGPECGEKALRPILVSQAVWLCLDSIVGQAQKGSTIKLSLQCKEDALRVSFQLEPAAALQVPREEAFCLPCCKLSSEKKGMIVLEALID
jgi:signal transduction histidine kinase